MKINKTIINKYAPIIYILFLVVSFFYVNKVLNSKTIEVNTKDDKEEQTTEVKPVKVKVEIYNKNTFLTSYELNMQNINTVDDLLEELRENYDFTYEKTKYTYGNEYSEIYGIKSDDAYIWKIYENNLEITFDTKSHSLINNGIYKFELSPR